MGTENGRAAVLGEAMAAASGELAAIKAAAEGDQVELFDIPTRFSALRGGERADAIAALERAKAEHRGRGRPEGAQNKSTAQLKEYLLKRGTHPLQQLMRWSMHTPESLAKELGCTPLEAFKELRTMWSDMTRYFVAPMVPVDETGQAVPFFQMIFGGSAGAPLGAAGDIPPWERRDAMAQGNGGQSVQNQQVIDAEPIVSHDTVSHDVPK